MSQIVVRCAPGAGLSAGGKRTFTGSEEGRRSAPHRWFLDADAKAKLAAMKDVRPLLYNLLLLVFLALLAWGLFKSAVWGWPEFVVCIIAAGFVALLGNMDRLESFKAGAGGIEAKTREVVAKAESAITELQLIAEATAAALFQLFDAGDRWGGAPAAEKDDRKAELVEVLKRLGVSESRLARLKEGERKWVLIDYVFGITDRLPRDPAKNQEWHQAWQPWSDGNRPAPAELAEILKIVEPLEPWRAELVKDYEHFYRTGEHRRPAIWRQRDSWHEWTEKGSWP